MVLDPPQDPERRQYELTLGFPPLDPRQKVHDTPKEMAKALRRAAHVIENMTDQQYQHHLDENYREARERANGRD